MHYYIIEKQKRRNGPHINEQIAQKNGDKKLFIAIFMNKDLFLRVKAILLAQTSVQ